MQAPDAFAAHRSPRHRLWVRVGLEPPAGGEWLQLAEVGLETVVEPGGPAGSGRGETRIVQVGGARGVWRVNRHGGLLGGLQADRYRSPRRLLEEVRLSESLRADGLDTPAVLLAIAERRGLFWRQHLVTEQIVDACTVFSAREDPAALRAAAALLERIFDLGLWAPDLHPGNLLWQAPQSRCWLIDLAGARRLDRPLSAEERAKRRRRFARFFLKHAGEVPGPFAGGS